MPFDNVSAEGNYYLSDLLVPPPARDAHADGLVHFAGADDYAFDLFVLLDIVFSLLSFGLGQ